MRNEQIRMANRPKPKQDQAAGMPQTLKPKQDQTAGMPQTPKPKQSQAAGSFFKVDLSAHPMFLLFFMIL